MIRMLVIVAAGVVALAVGSALVRGGSGAAPSDGPPPAGTAADPGGRAVACQYDELNVERGRLGAASAAVDGSRVASGSFRGGGNGYARGVRRVVWKPGTNVRYAISLLLPKGFHDRIQGQVDLMRWDNWPTERADADWGGVAIWASDRRARLLRFGDGRPEDVLVGPFDLPEGRWFRLTVVQRLDSRRAVSEVFLDGRRLGRSSAPNSYGRTVRRVRFGLVAVDSVRQLRPLSLDFAAPHASPAPSPDCRLTSGRTPAAG